MTENSPPASKPAGKKRSRLFYAVFALFVALVLFATLSIGVLIGNWAGQRDAFAKINRRYVQPFLVSLSGGPAPPPNEVTVAWEPLHSHFESLEIARFQLSQSGTPQIWALEQAGESLLFATRLGRFGYLTASNTLHTLDLEVPMDLAAIRQSHLANDPVFQIDQVRVMDLLVTDGQNGELNLFASHHRYNPSGDCFEHVVSRARIRASGDAITAISPDWDEIYVVRPCIPLKKVGMVFAGHEGGGRLVATGPDTILLSVGTYQFETPENIVGMNPDEDYGSIVEISVSQRRGRIFVQGLRNPQGLTLDSEGRVWETEHGPAGGDEVNLMRRGLNYGWPQVTYGLDYGPRPWPFNKHQGEHRGYEPPEFAFMPSIGISQIIEPSAKEFPLWEKHLLVASLYGETLFALKQEGDSIVYSEAIRIGGRLRDMFSMRDGRIAIVTDNAALYLIRSASRHADAPKAFTVSGFQDLPELQPEDIEPTDPILAGARVARYYCGSCHSTQGEIIAGPPLNGLFDREIGAFEGYAYSEALANASGRWTPQRLRGLLDHSDGQFAGTSMPVVELDKGSFDALVAYLRTTEATPASDPQ